jgi:hypothetical protein
MVSYRSKKLVLQPARREACAIIHPAGDTESHTMRFFPGNSRFNFGAIRGSNCTARFRVSDSRGT